MIQNLVKVNESQTLYFYEVNNPNTLEGTATLTDGKFTNFTGGAQFWIENDRSLAKELMGQDLTDADVFEDLAGWSNGDTFVTTTPR
jgi:hypothetical protein